MAVMAGYTKLFNSILASTVWNEPSDTRIVWITLLAMSGKNGIAEGSLPGLAVFARLPLEAVEVALERLSAPDRHSRSKEHEGRRIASVDGGWQILNHAKYRAQLGADERREYNRVKQAQYRKRGQMSPNVNHGEQCVDIAEAEAEADTEALEKPDVGSTNRDVYEQAMANYKKKHPQRMKHHASYRVR